jgi:sn-glycerol 3-phosphate transport system ATP-binding protein
MNMLPARLSADAARVELGGLGLPVEASATHGGCAVILGIRPEHLALAPEATQEAKQGLSLAVDFVEALGADTLAHGAIAGSGLRLTVRLPGTARVAEGDVLPLLARPSALHLFDAATGARL